MKPNEENLDEILERHLPSAPTTEMEADGERIWSRLRSRAEEGPARRVSAALPFAFGRPRTLAVLAVAAVLFLAFLGIVTFRGKTDAFMTIESADGLVYRASDVVYVGAKIGLNERLRSEGTMMLALADGSRVEVRAKSKLSLERADDGLRIHLQRGGIIVNAAKQSAGRRLYVRTKDVTVSVLGTVFLVNTEEQGSRVSVIEGEVRVQQGETEKSLRPGQQITTNPAMKPFPVTEEIAWSRRAPALLAQLQQSTTATGAAAAPVEVFETVSVRPSGPAAGGGGRGAGGGGGRTRNGRSDNPCSWPNEPRIDPRLFDTANSTLIQLIDWAYGLECISLDGSYVVLGLPEWAKKDGYDVQATRPEGPSDYILNPGGVVPSARPAAKLQRMMQAMLADRFQLSMHRETREMQAYVLSVAPGGPKYTASRPGPDPRTFVNGIPQLGQRVEGAVPNPEFSIWKEGDNPCCNGGGGWQIDGRRQPLSYVTGLLGYFLGRPIVDRTNLTGEYNFFLNFEAIQSADSRMPPVVRSREPGAPPPADSPTIFKVLEQIGLELKLGREKVDVWVVDRVERPSGN